jgi:hypothetical protein
VNGAENQQTDSQIKAEKITNLINGDNLMKAVTRINTSVRNDSEKLESPSNDQIERKVSKSKDASCGQGDFGSQSFNSDNKPKVNRDYCNICKSTGNLICCDFCPRSFHMKCLKFNKNEVPEGQWYCQTCR